MSIVALFDMTGYSVRDWAIAGETCFCLDFENDDRVEHFASGGSISYLYWNALQPDAKEFVTRLKPDFLIGFPPCTDLAVSGAAHFEAKKLANSSYQDEALYMVLLVGVLGKKLGIPWMLENPVGVLSFIWRKPDHSFNPCDFGGYLAPSDSHPQWSEYIAPRDAYNKLTCIWAKGIIWPDRKPVLPQVIVDKFGGTWSSQWAKLGGKDKRTKNIRSATPRGFARAIFEANYTLITGKPIGEIIS